MPATTRMICVVGKSYKPSPLASWVGPNLHIFHFSSQIWLVSGDVLLVCHGWITGKITISGIDSTLLFALMFSEVSKASLLPISCLGKQAAKLQVMGGCWWGYRYNPKTTTGWFTWKRPDWKDVWKKKTSEQKRPPFLGSKLSSFQDVPFPGLFCCLLDVSKNRWKTTQIIHFDGVWNHYKPSILGAPQESSRAISSKNGFP